MDWYFRRSLPAVSQQKSPHEDFIMAFIVCFLIFGAAWLIWHFFHLELTNALRWVRVGEMWLIKFIYGDDYSIIHPVAGKQVVKDWRIGLQNADVRDITVSHLEIMTLMAVPPLRYVFSGALGLMALWVVFFGPGTHFRRRMGLETLMKEQAKSFPAISPMLKFDPRKMPFRAPGQPVPAKLPLFAEALSPEEWIAYSEIPVTSGKLDPARAYHALSLQLGKRWQGPEKLPLHAQGIYAACALKHVRKRKDSEALLDEMSRSWSADKGFRPSGKLKDQIRKVIKDPKLGGALRKYADQHAFETTALLRCLSRAREEGGVLPPAQFLWLRGHDRTLWYPLNNLGRKSFHPEAVGALVHYTHELIAGQKIPTPRFEDVVKGLETYLKSGMSRAIPPLEKKAGGKR